MEAADPELLLLNGPRGYNELLASVTGISAKELTRNLAELSGSGLLERQPETSSHLGNNCFARGERKNIPVR